MAKKVATRPAPAAAGGAPKRPAGAAAPAGAPKRPAAPAAAAGAPKRPAGSAAPAGAPKKAPAPAAKGGPPGEGQRRGVTGQAGIPRPTVRPRTRRNAKKANASQRRGIPQGDYTLKSGESVPQVAIVRPTWEDGSMTFRPLPAWNPELASDGQWELDPYRFSQEELDFSDIYRKYPACYYVGQGDETLTMLLYDPDWDETEYNRKGNPYIALWNAVYRSVKRDFTHPEWLRMVEGKKSVLSRPCDLYFFQGLIFKRGADLYVGRGRSPKGLGQKDWPQIIQLKNSAGSTLVSLLNAINPEWDGDENDFENSMIAGDPVSPQHGRFFTIYNPKKEQLGGEDVSEMDSYEVGADGGVESADSDDIKGYRSRIDDCLMLNGRRTKIHARLEGPALEVAKSRIIFFDDIINLPKEPTDDAIDEMHAEQALLLARVLRGFRKMLEFGWHDHPEFFTSDVKKVLAAAKQVSMAGASKSEEEELYEEPVESATLGEDVESEFAESEDLDAAAEYEDVDADAEYEEVEVEEGAEGEAEYEEVEVEEGAEAEYEEVEVEEGAEGEAEYEEVEVEEAVAEEYEEVEEVAEGEEYEYEEVEVEVEEGEDAPAEGEEYEEEYEEVEAEEEAPEGGDDLDDEEEEARQALSQAQARAGARGAPAPAPVKKAAVKKAAPPAPAPVKKAAVKKAAPPAPAPVKKAAPAPVKKAAPAAPAAAPKKAAPPAGAPKKAPPAAPPKKAAVKKRPS